MSIEIREARQTDKKPLMSFIKHVWGGHDYIPQVWNAWLRETKSKMFVVLVDGRQVGMSRVRFLEDGSAWFEGARVHPDFRGRGLATALGERAMKVAKERGIKIFRLTSGSRNRSAHRQIARIGFRESSRFSIYVPSSRMRLSPQKGVDRLLRKDLREVAKRIRSSPEFKLGSGVMWDSFAARGLTDGVIEGALAQGHVYSTEGALAVAKLGGERDETWSQICFLTGDGVGAIKLVRHVFGSKGRRKTDWKLAYIPQGSGLIGELRSAGMKRDFSHILFERRAPKG